MPPSSRLWHSDRNLLEKCSHPPTCPSSSMFHLTESLTCCDAVGATLPPGLLTACSLEDSQDVSLFAQGMAMTNVDVSLAWEVSTATARPLLCRVDVATLPPVSPLHRQGLSVAFCAWPYVACLLEAESLSLIIALCFLGRFVLGILGLVFALCLCLCYLCPCLCSSDRSELRWHRLTLDVLLRSRDPENLLSHLIPACDSDAVPGEVLFHSHVLHSQHRHSYLDIVVYGLCGLVLVVVYEPLERRQLVMNVVCKSPTNLVRSLAPTPSRTASRLRTPRSRGHCDTFPTRLLQLSSPECSTSG